MTDKIRCQNPIFSENNIFFGCVTAKEDENALYLDKITKNKTNINADKIILDAVQTNTNIYWLPGVAITQFTKLKEYVNNQQALPTKYEYVGGITSQCGTRINKVIRGINDGSLMADLPYTVNEDDIAENKARLFPGIGRKEFAKINGDSVLPAIQIRIPNAYNYVLKYLEDLGIEVE